MSRASFSESSTTNTGFSCSGKDDGTTPMRHKYAPKAHRTSGVPYPKMVQKRRTGSSPLLLGGRGVRVRGRSVDARGEGIFCVYILLAVRSVRARRRSGEKLINRTA